MTEKQSVSEQDLLLYTNGYFNRNPFLSQGRCRSEHKIHEMFVNRKCFEVHTAGVIAHCENKGGMLI